MSEQADFTIEAHGTVTPPPDLDSDGPDEGDENEDN